MLVWSLKPPSSGGLLNTAWTVSILTNQPIVYVKNNEPGLERCLLSVKGMVPSEQLRLWFNIYWSAMECDQCKRNFKFAVIHPWLCLKLVNALWYLWYPSWGPASLHLFIKVAFSIGPRAASPSTPLTPACAWRQRRWPLCSQFMLQSYVTNKIPQLTMESITVGWYRDDCCVESLLYATNRWIWDSCKHG